MGSLKTTVAGDESGVRLDRWFRRRYPGIPHGRLERLLRTGQVRVDGRRARAGQRLEAGQEIRIPPLGDAAAQAPAQGRSRPPAPVRPAEAEALAARILWRDDDVIALDKPAGLAVQGGPGAGRHLDAMLDALRFDAPERPRLVHRLDRDTSGVLLLARNAWAAARLTAAFRTREARKLYWAVVVGVPKTSAGRIDVPLAKAPGPRGERVAADREAGRPAATRYRVIERAGRRAAWIAFEPETGRTHQIRVHAAALGTPILGDGKYGGRAAFLEGAEIAKRLHLHARAVRLPHPRGGVLEAAAPLPPHMAETWRFFGFSENLTEAGFGS